MAFSILGKFMPLNRLYYFLKPGIPFPVRVALRQWWAQRRRRVCAGTWPVDEPAGAAPPNWPGWPDGKRFAFVLTHDVEGTRGLQRVAALMELESRLGFRSSFNFVPEGEYRVPADLPPRLWEAGFEVGVHGLHHDGKLYSSKAEFARRAARIRHYMQEWHACGFRSPFMQREMSWLHLLGAEYDASTFDTDPFEPEPDGVRTIFPFWVPDGRGSGFVELPYTLVQDFTLLVVLREPNVDIWKRKLDWVAERGGMALLNTHPDYMCFGPGQPQPSEFPVALYEEFLRYARDTHGEQYWHALPRDVARYYCAALRPEKRNTRRRVCMVAYSTYESDGRIRRYAEELTKRGDLVEAISIAAGNTPLGVETTAGVAAYRIQYRDYKERGKLSYAWPLLRFLWAAGWALARRHEEVRYDLIHVHNIPDFLVFAALYPKLTGAKVILDIHDIVPELFAAKFGSRGGRMCFWLLRAIETAACRFADHVIVANHLWHKKLITRSVPAERCSVMMNHVDPDIFHRRPRTRHDGRRIALFHGSFQWHQGLDLAIEALATIRDRAPDLELHFYGGGGGADRVQQLRRLAERLGLNGAVRIFDPVPLDEVPALVANADLGLVPKRADTFGNEAYSTKIMEFMSQGVPVVVSRTKIDTYYFDEKTVRFFPSGDPAAMGEAMLAVLEDRALRESLVTAGEEYVARNNWHTKRTEYLNLVDTLTAERFEG